MILFSQEQNQWESIKKKSLNPGTASSISFKIENKGSEKTTYDLQVVSSDSLIRLILIKNTINLYAGEKSLVIIPLIIGAEVSPGEKTIAISARDHTGVSQFSDSTKIFVSRIKNISLTSLNTVEFAKAGELVSGSVLIKNKGNTRETLTLRSKYDIDGQDAELPLAAGEQRLITISHQTDPKIGKAQTINLDLAVSTSDSTNYSSNTIVTLIPVVPIQDDIYERFPISASITFLQMRNRNQMQNGFQGELYGKGSLNKEKSDLLEFRAVSKNPIEFNTFTQYEEYFINYKKDNFYAHLGDKVYSSSFLTEYARYGRGAEIQAKFGQMTVGGFYNRPRFFQDIKEEFNIYSTYKLHENTQFTAGYLYKTPLDEPNKYAFQNNLLQSDAHLPYLIAETRVLGKVDLLGEYSFSKAGSNQGSGYRVQADGSFKKIKANLVYLKASPLYAGYYTNTSMFNSNVQYKIAKKVDFLANFNQDARNFQRDTLFYAAPYRNSFQYGLNYRYNKNGNILFFNGYQKYDDRLTPKQFNYDEIFFRISLTHQFNTLQLNLESQFGKTDNHITDFSANSNYYTANLSYEKFNTWFNIFGSIARTSRYKERNQRQVYYGARIMSRLSARSTFNLFYQNNFMPEEYFRDRNQFELSYRQKIGQVHSFDLSGRYMLQRGQLGHKDFIVSLRYMMQLNVPIRKKSSYTTLAGRINNLGVKTTAGIKMNLGPHLSIADKEGNFIFKNVVPGDYFLEMDRSSTALTDISDTSLPVLLQIEEKSQNIFNFGMTSSATIKGQVKLVNSGVPELSAGLTKRNTKGKIPSNQVILEAISATQVFRKMGAIGEPFDFTYLRPGKWTLKIYNNNLDKGYQLLTDTYEVNLKAGETKELTIEIQKRQIEIKHQTEQIKIGYK